ncbi:hypothetical protein L3X38_012164 [Prunus dulcis]|uniref:Secreted protein n=1 Tax=Prunus dulcis TaxID=3755 RepID=A0AAD4ZEZ1_PRUDU|nr:hypothetical protein L3X38_012164 [Prunus dulcis]
MSGSMRLHVLFNLHLLVWWRLIHKLGLKCLQRDVLCTDFLLPSSLGSGRRSVQNLDIYNILSSHHHWYPLVFLQHDVLSTSVPSA